jgi:hypothetical protein
LPQKLEADVAQWQEEIPRDKATAEELSKQLAAAEEKLEAMQDSIKGEVEGYLQQLSKVRQALKAGGKCLRWLPDYSVQFRIHMLPTEGDLQIKNSILQRMSGHNWNH